TEISSATSRPRFCLRRSPLDSPLLILSQDFRFGFLATIDCTSHRLRWSRFFHPFHPERLQRPWKGPALPPPRTEKPRSASFQAISHTPLRPPSFLRPVCLAAAPYPVGKGSAAIRRTMLPNRRGVRWLS